jgi:hypothetical protein
MINGVRIVPLRQTWTARQDHAHAEATDPHFLPSLIYFSTARRAPQGLAHPTRRTTPSSPAGPSSSSTARGLADEGELQEIYLARTTTSLVRSRRDRQRLAYGDKQVILANAASEPHDPDEMLRLPPATSEIPYDWARRDG